MKNAAIVKGVFMFRLRKGQQDDKNRKNDADEKNTHEIKLKIKIMIQMMQIWINRANISLISATFSRSTILGVKRSA